MLLLYLNFSTASSEKAFLVHSNFKASRLCLVPALSIRYRDLWASLIDAKDLLRQKQRSGVRKLWVAPICAAVHVTHNQDFPMEDAVSALDTGCVTVLSLGTSFLLWVVHVHLKAQD